MNRVVVLFLLPLLSTLLVACASSQPIKTADGSAAYRIKCFDSMACHEMAADLCNGSYKIMSTKDTATETWVYIVAKCENKRSRSGEISGELTEAADELPTASEPAGQAAVKSE
jgi:hypothetical protein